MGGTQKEAAPFHHAGASLEQKGPLQTERPLE
jgi:hypothetical protein